MISKRKKTKKNRFLGLKATMYIIVFPQLELQQHFKLTLVKREYLADFPSYMKFIEAGAMLKVYEFDKKHKYP